jgi:hypothetical protein
MKRNYNPDAEPSTPSYQPIPTPSTPDAPIKKRKHASIGNDEEIVWTPTPEIKKRNITEDLERIMEEKGILSLVTQEETDCWLKKHSRRDDDGTLHFIMEPKWIKQDGGIVESLSMQHPDSPGIFWARLKNKTPFHRQEENLREKYHLNRFAFKTNFKCCHCHKDKWYFADFFGPTLEQHQDKFMVYMDCPTKHCFNYVHYKCAEEILTTTEEYNYCARCNVPFM